MRKLLLIAAAAVLAVSGCTTETNTETLNAFHKGYMISCESGHFPTTYTVVTNKNYTYDPRLNKFIHIDSKQAYNMNRCYSRAH